jgi:GNAT superfamily N-acetyltransferase
MTDYTFQRERVQDTIDEAYPLLVRHWDEIAWTKELSGVDINRDFYKAIEDRGEIICVTARHDGALIGYAVYFLRLHPHYQTVRWAVSDIYWLAPEHRGRALGARLFVRVELELRRVGVRVMHTTGKTAHPAAKRLLEALGHTDIEWGVGKVLS